MTADKNSRRISILIWCLVVIAAWSALWPAYRAFLNIEISVNEGWSAYYSDAAMNGTTLYPARDQLITNNYPPLSFYFVGALGRLAGDSILAGRLVSLAALALTAVGVALAIKRLGGDTKAACVGAAFFMGTMCRFFTFYVGMNDPHLLAQAVMMLGFVAFLRAMARDSGYAIPILLMVVAGFFKHNIVAMPLTAMVWLGIRRPRQMVKSGLLAACAIAAGLALCYAAYGPDFFANMTSPRAFHWGHAFGATGHLQWPAVGLIAWCYVGFTRRHEPGVQFCNLFVAMGLLFFFLEKTGDGVSYNAEFELIIGVSIGTGLAFAQAPFLPLARRWSPDALRFSFLLLICLRLIASARMEPVRMLYDRAFYAEIATREAAMADTVARIKMTPGDVASNAFACYRAGKPFEVDVFNCEQRIMAGKLPPDAISKLVDAGKLTEVKENPLLRWSFTPDASAGPADNKPSPGVK